MSWSIYIFCALAALSLISSTAITEDIDESKRNAPPKARSTIDKQTKADETRLAIISDAVAAVRKVIANPTSNSTAYELASVYDQLIANLTPGSYPIPENLANVILELVDETAAALLLLDDHGIVTFPSTALKEVTSLEGLQADIDGGLKLFESAALNISETCMVSLVSGVGLIILPKNACPLRPLPRPNGTVTSYNVVHVSMIRTALFYFLGYEECSSSEFFQVVILRFNSLTGVYNARYGCAKWLEDRGFWSTEYCYSFKRLDDKGMAECHCDTMYSEGTSEFMIYEYTEDMAEFIEIKLLNVTGKALSEVSEIDSQEKSLSSLGLNPKITSAMFETLIDDILFNVMQFDSSVLIDKGSATILEDVGRVMEAVEPSDGSGVIGRGNQLLYGFVFDLKTYTKDPLIAYSFYNLSTHTVDMEYLRSTEREDYNRLFNYGIEYSLLFSKSVIVQNSRYAFILYPLQKYFKQIMSIDGIEVVASRVLDLFLAPVHDAKDTQEQLLHMFFNPDSSRKFYSGCAYWSVSLGAWTSMGCHPNPDLYLDVCTCNMSAHFAESRTRVQYLTYKYPVFDSSTSALQLERIFSLPVLFFGLSNLVKYYRGRQISNKALAILNSFYTYESEETFKLSAAETIDAINDVRNVLLVDTTLNTENLRRRMTLCKDFFGGMGGSPDNPIISEWGGLDFYCYGDFKRDEAVTFTSEEDYFGLAIHMSDSLKAQNERFALLIYPKNYNVLHPLPKIGQRILKSHVVDVLRTPSELADEYKVTEKVTILIYERHYNCSLGCAVWDETLSAWTSNGCMVIPVHMQDSCECNVTGNATVTQVLVYMYNDVTFDERTYKRVISGSDPNNLDDFTQGVELIHNMTLFPFEKNSFLNAMRIYMRLLSLDVDVLVNNRLLVSHLLDDLEFVISDYEANAEFMDDIFFGIHGSQSLKSADIATDLFSNAVLSAEDPGEIAKTTDMSIVALGFYGVFGYKRQGGQSQGFFFDGDSTEQLVSLQDENSFANVFKNTPSFVCFIVHRSNLDRNRLVFVVYPLNKTPYPLTMTTDAIFNVRQMDVYVGGDKLISEILEGEALIDLYFHETAVFKWYVKIACSSWDESQRAWSKEICTPFTFRTSENASIELCRCNITGCSVTRVVLYEYTSLKNFSKVTSFDGTTIVFHIGAVLSMFGLVMIILTAILFAKWREELGNKIMMNLTASTLIYLSLTAYRETHLIYADSNHDSIAVIVFTVCVHYSRLTHFCWGLVMSVLQYKRFSGVVGASIISHLLLKVSLLAWGVPVIPLAILLSWQQSVHFCSPDKITHYILYLVPGVVITLVNLGLMAAIIRTITNGCGLWEDEELQRHGVDNKEVMLRRLKQTVLMFFLFGIPAVFEMVNDIGANSHSVVLDYINNILDPIQGFVLFLFFILIDDKTRGYWHNKLYGKEAVIAGQPTAKKMPIKLQFIKSRVGPKVKPLGERNVGGEEIAMEVLKGGARLEGEVNEVAGEVCEVDKAEIK